MTVIDTAPTLDAHALDDGRFAMIAMDQRESLRQMLHKAGREGTDAELVEFKLDVAAELAGAASGFLIDHDHGFAPVLGAGSLPPRCGLILAADILDQPPGEGVADTDLSDDALRVAAATDRVCAAKLLIIWKNDGGAQRRLAVAERFVRECRERGLLSVLEGVAVAHPDDGSDWDLDAAIRDAARELGGLRPDLYKAQVPRRGVGAPNELGRACERLAAVLTVPWVVLSNGVALEDFPRGVEAACRAGASGMLAGRALWSDALAAPDPRRYLREHCLDRLRRLAGIVGRHARPWTEVV